MPSYKRPPITEAVIEFRYSQPISEALIRKGAKRLKLEYEFVEEEATIDVRVDVATKTQQTKQQFNGIRLSSFDRVDIVILRMQAFSCSRLAPYGGWEEFRQRAYDAWTTWRRQIRSLNIARVGVRYINRIDIPMAKLTGGSFEIEDYLLATTYLPTLDLPPISNYTLQVGRPLGIDDCKLLLTTATVPSPLVGHVSLALDIDILRDTDVPQTDSELWVLVDQIRHHKNRIFESCVTDKSRELFNL